MIDDDLALERVLAEGDEWQSWRALRLSGEAPGEAPAIPYQDELGGSLGPSGAPFPGATGELLCHLRVLGLEAGPHAVVAADWLESVRTPAKAWLDSPDDVPGELDNAAGARVWATASAAAGMLAVGRDPGARAIDLLRGEADNEGRFTGGVYPTLAGAAAYWLAAGPRTEMSEWALRWLREGVDDRWDPWDFATGLTYFAAAGIPLENATVDLFVERLTGAASAEGFPDLGLTLRALEVMRALGA